MKFINFSAALAMAIMAPSILAAPVQSGDYKEKRQLRNGLLYNEVPDEEALERRCRRDAGEWNVEKRGCLRNGLLYSEVTGEEEAAVEKRQLRNGLLYNEVPDEKALERRCRRSAGEWNVEKRGCLRNGLLYSEVTGEEEAAVEKRQLRNGLLYNELPGEENLEKRCRRSAGEWSVEKRGCLRNGLVYSEVTDEEEAVAES